MSEEDNWQLYQKELDRLVASHTPFIPFLGNFLTRVVQMQSFEDLKQKSRSLTRRSSIFETYAILEPITVRKWLQRASGEGKDSEGLFPRTTIDSTSGEGITEESVDGAEDTVINFNDVDIRLRLTKAEENEHVERVSPNDDDDNTGGTLESDSSCCNLQSISSSQIMLEFDGEGSKTQAFPTGTFSSNSAVCSRQEGSKDCLLSPVRANGIESLLSSGDDSDISLSDLDARIVTNDDSADEPTQQPSPRHPRRSLSMDCLYDAPWDQAAARPDPAPGVKKFSSLEGNLDADRRSRGQDSNLGGNTVSQNCSACAHDRSRSAIATLGHISHSVPTGATTCSCCRCSSNAAAAATGRRRHTAEVVARISQDSSESEFDLLHRYQLLSIGCCEGLEARVDLRVFIGSCSHNSEGLNYRLSYSLET